MERKFIFVTGGVVSALGKGIATASIGWLLKRRGYRVTIQKFDPYINVDPGTMNPYQHGEVFVTEDGAETDLDLGHYERFLDQNLSRENNYTTGQIYNYVIEKERKGEFLGETVQVVPHITDAIKYFIIRLAEKENVDVLIAEIGGTVGDIESQPFLEAIRQISLDYGKKNVLYVHLTLVPYVKSAGELKTKPTQHSVKELRTMGIQPDVILCRSESKLPQQTKDKIALFCSVRKNAVIEVLDTENIYEIPLIFHQQKLDELIVDMLGLEKKPIEIKDWEEFVERAKNAKEEVKIAIVGKYSGFRDSYKSVIEALAHSAAANDVKLNLKWIESEEVNNLSVEELLKDVSGILIPGGFGKRGIEGKIRAIQYARENKIPFLGLCVGLQCAIIEFARNILGLKNANSTEFDPNTPYPVIDLLPEQKKVVKKGGTMRLGVYPCVIKDNTLAFKCYQNKHTIYERHRHRYEINPKYHWALEEKGMIISGRSPDGVLGEIAELSNHPFFITTQFHPEFTSRPLKPHPLFYNFIKNIKKYARSHSSINVKDIAR